MNSLLKFFHKGGNSSTIIHYTKIFIENPFLPRCKYTRKGIFWKIWTCWWWWWGAQPYLAFHHTLHQANMQQYLPPMTHLQYFHCLMLSKAGKQVHMQTQNWLTFLSVFLQLCIRAWTWKNCNSPCHWSASPKILHLELSIIHCTLKMDEITYIVTSHIIMTQCLLL